MLRDLVKKNLPPQILRWRWHNYYWREFNGAGESELRELVNLVPKDRMAIDVGGSVGTYTFHLSRIAKSVLTFEPNPNLHWRYPKLNLHNVQVEHVALSDQPGTATLRIPAHLRDHGRASLEEHLKSTQPDAVEVQVPLRTLDSYNLDNVGFIKIDTEGHEEAVLRGAVKLIDKCRPTFLIEIEEVHNPGGLVRVNGLLASHGYECFFFDKGERHPLSDFDQARDQSPNFAKAPQGKRYINNFIFKHKSG